MLLSPSLSAERPQPPAARAVPALAVRGGGPGRLPGAGTAGPGAIPGAVVPAAALAPERDQELSYLTGSSMKRGAGKSLGLLGLLSTAETEGPVMGEKDHEGLHHTRTQSDWRQEKERGV